MYRSDVNLNDHEYHSLLKDVLTYGKGRKDRTGVGTISMFAPPSRTYTIQDFPLITTKRVHFKSIKGELLWMLSGSTNANELRNKYGVTIWDEWADGDGELGPIYGKQWRNSGGKDQIEKVVSQIESDPYSRRIILNSWNVAELDDMALPPCHVMAQWYVQEGVLSCQMYQRSADLFLGVPFNIAQYSLLTQMLAHVTNTIPGTLTHVIGDAHIYFNHVAQVREQLSRDSFPGPTVKLNPDVKSIDKFTMDDIQLVGYNSQPPIKGDVAV